MCHLNLTTLDIEHPYHTYIYIHDVTICLLFAYLRALGVDLEAKQLEKENSELEEERTKLKLRLRQLSELAAETLGNAQLEACPLRQNRHMIIISYDMI